MHRDRTADKATAKLRLDEMDPVKRLLLLARITLRHVRETFSEMIAFPKSGQIKHQ